MAQLSRPFQVGLAAVAVLGAAWLLLLRPHTTPSSSGSGSPASAPAPAAPSAAPKGSATYHGSAPGVAGLSRAIAKANAAVATSQQNAKQLEEKSAQASSATATATAGATATKPAPASGAPAPAKVSLKPVTPGAASRSAALVRQHAVEAQLAKGRIVVILFWDSKGADDRAVHSALRTLSSQHGLGISVQEASANQVASFGTITRGLQVYGTPTVLIVDKQGKAKTLTGLQDAYGIAQAIRELRHP
jgi:hypothetical protein